MHELRCGDICSSDGSHELHRLFVRVVLNSNRGVSIDDMLKLCGRHLRGEHGINIVLLMQHGIILDDKL